MLSGHTKSPDHLGCAGRRQPTVLQKRLRKSLWRGADQVAVESAKCVIYHPTLTYDSVVWETARAIH